MMHRDLRKLTEDELRRELEESKAKIEDLTGRACRTFAYPFGLYAQREIEGGRGSRVRARVRRGSPDPGEGTRHLACRVPRAMER